MESQVQEERVGSSRLNYTDRHGASGSILTCLPQRNGQQRSESGWPETEARMFCRARSPLKPSPYRTTTASSANAECFVMLGPDCPPDCEANGSVCLASVVHEVCCSSNNAARALGGAPKLALPTAEVREWKRHQISMGNHGLSCSPFSTSCGRAADVQLPSWYIRSVRGASRSRKSTFASHERRVSPHLTSSQFSEVRSWRDNNIVD